jgi:hypothetical protein
MRPEPFALEGGAVSEYQYYDFRAIDHPLDEKDMAALRAISSRAEITPTSLTNVYNWGDFKGNPDRLMDRYFDAHRHLRSSASRSNRSGMREANRPSPSTNS